MMFVLPTPTLQHLAAVSIVGRLWNQRSIFTQTAELITPGSDPHFERCSIQYTVEWKKIVDMVKSKASTLPVPQTLIQRIQNFVLPLGIEILNWFEENHQQIGDLHPFRNFLPRQFCWTFLGTVDYKKTAELMVKNEELDIEKRYKIACANCFEDDIRRLLERIPEDRKLFLIDEMKYLGTTYHRNLIFYWTCAVSFEMDELNKYFQNEFVQGDDINHYLLKCALSFSNRIASEYFFDKLSQDRKDEVLVTLPMHLEAIASCLMRRLNETQQEKLLEERHVYILKHLICWPNQSLFVEKLKRAMQFLHKGSFIYISSLIADKTLWDYYDYNYDELYLKFWQLSPDEFKNYFLDDKFCKDSLKYKDDRFIKMFLDEFAAHQFDKFLQSYGMAHPRLREVIKNENAVSEETLNGWKRKVALEWENERDEEKRAKCENVLRFFNSLLEVRRRKGQKRGRGNGDDTLGKTYKRI